MFLPNSGMHQVTFINKTNKNGHLTKIYPVYNYE